MKYNEKVTTLKRMAFHKIAGLFIFLLWWVMFCIIADKIFHLDADAWRMGWGYLAGTVSIWVSETVADAIHPKTKPIDQAAPK